MDRERPEGVFVESTAVSVSAALALSACYTFFKPVLNLQNSRPIGHGIIWLGCIIACSYSISPMAAAGGACQKI